MLSVGGVLQSRDNCIFIFVRFVSAAAGWVLGDEDDDPYSRSPPGGACQRWSSPRSSPTQQLYYTTPPRPVSLPTYHFSPVYTHLHPNGFVTVAFALAMPKELGQWKQYGLLCCRGSVIYSLSSNRDTFCLNDSVLIRQCPLVRGNITCIQSTCY